MPANHNCESYTKSATTYTTPSVPQVYTLIPMASVFLDMAIFGGAVIALGALLAALYVRRTASATPA